MITYKKSILALFIAIGLGASIEAEVRQNHTIDQQDPAIAYAGRSTQVPVEASSEEATRAKVQRAIAERDARLAREKAFQTAALIHTAIIFGPPLVYQAIRYAMVGPDEPYADWEGWLAGFWVMMGYASLI